MSFYYQKPGKSTYSKLGSKKIDSKGKVRFKTKKVMVVDGAPYAVKIGNAPFAPGFVIPGAIGPNA